MQLYYLDTSYKELSTYKALPPPQFLPCPIIPDKIPLSEIIDITAETPKSAPCPARKRRKPLVF